MHKYLKIFIVFIFLLILSQVIDAESSPELLIHNFDEGELSNPFGGGSGAWLLNPEDENQSCNVSLDIEMRRVEKGFCLKLDYDLDSPEQAQGGFWTQLRKKDLSDYDHLQFFVRGDPKEGFAQQFRVEFKKPKDDKGVEKLVGSFLVQGVTDHWQEILVPLNKMVGITDWTGIDEFVIVLKDRMVSPKKGTLYFDDIRLVRTGDPGPSIVDPIPKIKTKASDQVSGVDRAKVLINRLYGYPKEVLPKKKFSDDSNEFLREVAKDIWGFFRDIVDKENGLPLDNFFFSKESTLTENTFIGDYTNVTNIGLYLMCLVSGLDLGFIDHDKVVKRISRVLDTVEHLESEHGFLYNYYDTTTRERTSNFLSYVDEGWLTIGMIIVKDALPKEFKERCEKLLSQRDFSFFYDPIEGQMFHGFYTNVGVYSEYHYGAFYTEPRAISFMCIGRGQAPLEHWFMMSRTFPESYSWQSQIPKERVKKSVLGYSFYGGYYNYRDLPIVPSWGGSLFEALMPSMVIDEKGLAPLGLGLNNERYVQGHILFAREDMKYPVWGMSPCSIPPGSGYGEYGATPLGMKPYGQGVVTPHVTFLSLEYATEECVKNLRKMMELYPIYGEYGFYDAVDVRTGLVSYKYLCLDQAMSFIALNNYLNHGAIRNRLMNDPIFEKSKKLLKEEKFFE
ncbi:MAG: hypothetical protein HYS07_00400 [Chlamydiae bacterium]|nr:hypothetical protein [Chlamydiota bacterium]MBI3278119.1 hypothetical protein [Chlamydiota bacterium]